MGKNCYHNKIKIFFFEAEMKIKKRYRCAVVCLVFSVD